MTEAPLPGPPAVAEALSQLHDSIQEQVKEAAAEFAKKRPNGVVANLLGGARRRLQTVGVVRFGIAACCHSATRRTQQGSRDEGIASHSTDG